jgi:hypothetical protein
MEAKRTRALAEADHPITFPPSASVTYLFIRKSCAENAQSMDALPVLPQTRECPTDFFLETSP